MEIANPIYDVVFKYLMEDGKIAKLIISSIIGEDISELTFLPSEFSTDIQKPEGTENLKLKKKTKKSKTIYRLDFSAKIKTPEGYKQVIIEIQKAKFAADIMRFRRYLAGQYADKENTQIIPVGKRNRKFGIPIVSIYFLGHKLESTKSSIIGIKRTYYDLVTGQEIKVKEPFIESLTHDSYVIQIPTLTKKRRNDLETLLSIFDQSMVIDNEHHILSIKEEEYPEKYRLVIRKLQIAIQNPQIKKIMILEDDILDEWADLDRENEVLTIENELVKNENEQVKNENEIIKNEKERIEKENEILKKRLEELEKLKK